MINQSLELTLNFVISGLALKLDVFFLDYQKRPAHISEVNVKSSLHLDIKQWIVRQ
jgi:hypothetical protein